MATAYEGSVPGWTLKSPLFLFVCAAFELCYKVSNVKT